MTCDFAQLRMEIAVLGISDRYGFPVTDDGASIIGIGECFPRAIVRLKSGGTALFWIEEEKLCYVQTLPSTGDLATALLNDALSPEFWKSLGEPAAFGPLGGPRCRVLIVSTAEGASVIRYAEGHPELGAAIISPGRPAAPVRVFATYRTSQLAYMRLVITQSWAAIDDGGSLDVVGDQGLIKRVGDKFTYVEDNGNGDVATMLDVCSIETVRQRLLLLPESLADNFLKPGGTFDDMKLRIAHFGVRSAARGVVFGC